MTYNICTTVMSPISACNKTESSSWSTDHYGLCAVEIYSFPMSGRPILRFMHL